ncbi:serine hydrolase [Croceicoccus estronivorus]|nr:serine hydrolase [Croceicoccus estronivorus]
MGKTGPALSRRALLGQGVMLGASLALVPQFALAEVASWPGVTRYADNYVRTGKVAGAVAAMGVGQETLDVIARGRRTLQGGVIDGDSLFRIYSMTKPITGMAAMMLIDEGLLELDQPLAEILPKYAHMQVQRVADGSVSDLVPAERPITIRHLLTHTSGLGYSIVQQGPIKAAYVQAGLVPGRISRLPLAEMFGAGNTMLTLAQFADRLATMPLVYQPGTKWSYSVGLDLIGRVIEVVSGQSFDAFLQQRLFDPLGMTSTFFRVPQTEVGRLTTNYGVLGGVLLPLDPAGASVFLNEPAFPFGGSGLVSSPRDYDRFLRMLLGFGKFEGRRVMAESAVRIGTSNLLPDGISTVGTFATGGGFGAGGRVGLGREAGTFGWAGAAGTIAFADLKRGWRGGYYTQYMPASAYPIQKEFPEVAMKDALAALGVNA